MKYRVIKNFPNSYGVKVGDILYPYKSKTYFCILERTNMMTDIQCPQNYPELFEPVSEKTSNPSKKKGFDNLEILFKKALKKYAETFIDRDDCWEQFKKDFIALQANGETPEVDNPVPSLDNCKVIELVEDLLDAITNPYFQTIEYIEESLKQIEKQLKNGRETDKKQPDMIPIEYLKKFGNELINHIIEKYQKG